MDRDTQDFLDLLNNLNHHPYTSVRDLFDTKSELIVSRAPGRLDLMGGIADYSGSHVLEFPIGEATFAAVQRGSSRHLHIVTLLDGEESTVSISIDRLGTFEYDTARKFFERNEKIHWVAYVAGVFLVLMRECGASFESGADILISSRVPPGKGVSSSAALEVAVMQAVTEAFDIEIEGRDKALLCQKVENLVAGAPCGVMDQMTAVFGERDRLLFMLCQPAELKRMITLPPQLMLWGIDSGIRHSVGGADYGTVRAAAFMGTRIIAELNADFSKDGYLANISPAEFEREYLDRLPERIRMPTAHPIYENVRVQRFVELLERNEGYDELGELMYEAHRSYTALGLNSAGTDLIVELVRKEAGLFGAKITGGGSGGTVAVLGDQTSRAAVERVAANYAKETGHQPYIFSGSSPGALAFGHLRVSIAR
jgi:galactokinase